MNGGIEGSFINFVLVKDVETAISKGVIEDDGIEQEEEQRHISELERRMRALDEAEIYVTLKTFIKYHKATIQKIFTYIEEGEKKNEKRNAV